MARSHLHFSRTLVGIGLLSLVLCGCAGGRTVPEAQPESHPDSTAQAAGIFLDDEEAVSRWVPNADQPVMSVSDTGLDVTRFHEKFEAKPYNDPIGLCTIGYGHLIKRSPCDGAEAATLRDGISPREGLEMLREDMGKAERAVMALVKPRLTQGQFDALCDFVFNVGRGNFAKSTLLKEINAGRLDQASSQLRRWTKAGGKTLQGLVARREAEIGLYQEGMPETRSVPRADMPLDDVDIRGGEAQ